jgi:peptidoglycan/LPS O-acetylase OafA/YrhL
MRGSGAVSLIVLAFSWLALDDITTDNAARFPLEYTMLVLAGVWFSVLGAWLVAKGRAVAGIGSLVAVVMGVVAFWSLPHHYQPPSAVNNFGYAPLAWFLVLAAWLVAARDRSGGGVARSRTTARSSVR